MSWPLLVAGSRRAMSAGLTRIVPFKMVDAALAETGATQRRIRDLPSRVVVYLLLAAGLLPISAIRRCGHT